MSADEDTELRDLVAQTLEANGVLGKIRAQLRASVFLALEEQETVKHETPFLNSDLKKFMSTREGRVVAGLVREFLEHFNLEFTLSVFDPEVGVGEHYEGRGSLARDLSIIESPEGTSQPLLSEVVRRCCNDSGTPRGRKSSNLDDLNSSHILEARQKFEQYDHDRSGTIEKDELRALFMDMFPSFHKNMLDRYVNDEFKAIDKDFSNSIDFEEFLQMYKRLFVLCKSVVSHDVSDMMSPRLGTTSGSRIPGPLKKIHEEKDDLQLDLDLPDQSNSSDSIEARNKRNSESSDRGKASPRSTSPVSPGGKDLEDAFFDDPIPNNDHAKMITRNQSPHTSPRPSGIPVRFGDGSKKPDEKSGGLSFLGDLPSLGGDKAEKKKTNKGNNDLENDIQAIDKKIADLGFEVPIDDYDDDDFESSKSEERSVSPFGQTPRSQKSDHNVKSISEDLDDEDEVEEEFSVAEDLLKSDNSGMDDLTTDRTISPVDQSGAFDYMEDVALP